VTRLICRRVNNFGLRSSVSGQRFEAFGPLGGPKAPGQQPPEQPEAQSPLWDWAFTTNPRRKGPVR